MSTCSHRYGAAKKVGDDPNVVFMNKEAYRPSSWPTHATAATVILSGEQYASFWAHKDRWFATCQWCGERVWLKAEENSHDIR